MILFLLLVLLVVGFVAYAGGWRPQFGQWAQPGGAQARGGGSDALEILRVRYARGDISHEEYLRMREVLQG